MKKQKLGLFLLIGVIIIAGIYQFFMKNKMPEVKINGLLGGEKIGLFENDAFKKIAKDKSGLTLDYRKAGSYDMVREDSSKYDYLFPSSQLALDLYKKNGGSYKRQEIVFNTPIVLYSRKPIVEALEMEKIVTKEEETYYVDMTKLAKLIVEGKSWKDLNLPQLYGNVLVDTTDPNKSNSGNMFLGLLANSLNNGQMVTKQNVADLLPSVRKIYQQIGHMQSSSADMFSQFLKQGMGAFPIIAGYESQILEFSKIQPDVYDKVKDEIVILYPSPTVWSSHVYISLTENGDLGLDMLLDKETQEIAWKYHGYRTIVSGTGDTNEFKVAGIPKQITRVAPMPDIDAMLKLMDSIRED